MALHFMWWKPHLKDSGKLALVHWETYKVRSVKMSANDVPGYEHWQFVMF